jgi:predicted Holliday junction resolvase-like endonuclease
LVLLLRLRQICNHPYLVTVNTDSVEETTDEQLEVMKADAIRQLGLVEYQKMKQFAETKIKQREEEAKREAIEKGEDVIAGDECGICLGMLPSQ